MSIGCSHPSLKRLGPRNRLLARLAPGLPPACTARPSPGLTLGNGGAGGAAIAREGAREMAVGQNPALVNIKIGGKWMLIHTKMGSPQVMQPVAKWASKLNHQELDRRSWSMLNHFPGQAILGFPSFRQPHPNSHPVPHADP